MALLLAQRWRAGLLLTMSRIVGVPMGMDHIAVPRMGGGSLARHAPRTQRPAPGSRQWPLKRPRSSSNGSEPPVSPAEPERFVDLRDVLSQAKQLGGEALLFRDEPGEHEADHDSAWGAFEARFAETTNIAAEPQPAVRGALDAEALDPAMLDVLSAYSPEQGFQEVSPQELRAQLDDPAPTSPTVLLDVRSASEYAAGHVPGSLHADLAALSEMVRSGALDSYKSARVVTVCGGGARAAQAAVRLRRVLGFEDVAALRGGVPAWESAGYGLERGA